MENKTVSIYAKLQKARVKLQKKGLKKTGKNSFAKFNYFELADFLPSVNEIFDELGLCSVFNIHTINGEQVAQLTIVDSETDANISFSSPTAEASVKGAIPIQNLGSLHTYMRRYLMMNALEIVECDAVDATIGSDKQKQNNQAPAPQQVFKYAKDNPALINDLASVNVTLQQVADFRKKSIDLVTEEEVINIIQRKRAQQK